MRRKKTGRRQNKGNGEENKEKEERTVKNGRKGKERRGEKAGRKMKTKRERRNHSDIVITPKTYAAHFTTDQHRCQISTKS